MGLTLCKVSTHANSAIMMSLVCQRVILSMHVIVLALFVPGDLKTGLKSESIKLFLTVSSRDTEKG